MTQKNLDKEKCNDCGKYIPIDELYSGVIYHPFDDLDNPSYEYSELCERCEMILLECADYCEMCDREIFRSNGLRKNIRYFPEFPDAYYDDNNYDPTICCVKCCQKIWFEYGMENFKDADWFFEAELQNSDYTKYRTFFNDYDKAEKLFNKLRENGKDVIISLESSGMGLEHTYSLWIKPNKDFIGR